MGGGGGAPGGGGGAPGGGGGGGGGGGPQPRRDVVNLVRKIDILTGDIQITLTQEQTNAIRQALAGVEDEMTLSDEAAQAKYDEIAKLLTSEQMKTQSLVELPRLPRDNRLGTPGYSSPSIPEDLNPFTQQEVKEMLSSLRAKLGGSEDIPDATNGDAALDSGATDKSSSNDAGADDDNQQHPE